MLRKNFLFQREVKVIRLNCLKPPLRFSLIAVSELDEPSRRNQACGNKILVFTHYITKKPPGLLENQAAVFKQVFVQEKLNGPGAEQETTV